MKNGNWKIAALAGLGLSFGTTASAGIVFNFANASGTFGGSVGGTPEYTVGSLTDGSPTEADPGGLDGRTSLSGTLSGVANTDSFSFTYDTFRTSSISAGVLSMTFIGSSAMASNSVTGIASADGDINAGGRGIFFQFDLSGLPANTGLRITDLTATTTGGANHDLQVVVGDLTTVLAVGSPASVTVGSETNTGGLSGSGLSIDITDGDFVAFRNAGTGGTGDKFRLTSMTVETFLVPEPSSLALLGLGGLLIARRRRG